METRPIKKEEAAVLRALWSEAWNLHKGVPVNGELAETEDGVKVVVVPVYLDPPKPKRLIGFCRG